MMLPEFENWMAGRGLSVVRLIKSLLKIFLACSRKPSGEGLESFWRTDAGIPFIPGRMKAFSNIDDIERMFNQVKIAKIKGESKKHVLRWWRRDALFEQYINPHSVMQWMGGIGTARRIMG
uniref:Uncharacterized protein n=1 Tax=Salmonella sp. TaxID=599 RepID=A0A482EVX5_SALSP|nr:hypothetical protein [Salmonella sp.]QBM91389.1 hypothetical protein NNIBIDOC_00056 [Salmonella sp.]